MENKMPDSENNSSSKLEITAEEIRSFGMQSVEFVAEYY
jgi:hypothetical protein